MKIRDGIMVPDYPDDVVEEEEAEEADDDESKA